MIRIRIRISPQNVNFNNEAIVSVIKFYPQTVVKRLNEIIFDCDSLKDTRNIHTQFHGMKKKKTLRV